MSWVRWCRPWACRCCRCCRRHENRWGFRCSGCISSFSSLTPSIVRVGGIVHPLCGPLNAVTPICRVGYQLVHTDSTCLGVPCSAIRALHHKSATWTSWRCTVIKYVLPEYLPVSYWWLLSLWLWNGSFVNWRCEFVSSGVRWHSSCCLAWHWLFGTALQFPDPCSRPPFRLWLAPDRCHSECPDIGAYEMLS